MRLDRLGKLVGIDGLQGVAGGGASGWEMDCSSRSDGPVGGTVGANVGSDRGKSPDNLVVLARGTNWEQDGAADHAAELTYYETGSGGFVFCTGSICFGGSLVQDPDLQQITRNALNRALAH